MIYASEGLLYVCFAILTGSLLLRLVPERSKPAVHVPDGLLLACAVAVPLLSFVPLHQLTADYAESFGMTYGAMLKSVLLDVNAGKAWVWTLLGSAGLAVLLGVRAFRQDKHMPKAALFVVFLLIVWLGYSSHASSLSALKGLVVHSTHVLAFSVWIGILFAVGWFAKDSANWDRFLRWFSPVAIIAVLLTLLAGITLMTFTTPEYLNAWMLPYGQMMLIKHVLLLPLLLFAYTNGFRYKAKLRQDSAFNPRPWLKAESAVALLVLAATAVMGTQAPPHVVKETLQTVSPSALFTRLNTGPFNPDMSVTLSFGMDGALMFAAALIMIAALLLSHRLNKLMPAFVSGLAAASFVYLGFMFSTS